jgi:hypothetical protein
MAWRFPTRGCAKADLDLEVAGLDLPSNPLRLPSDRITGSWLPYQHRTLASASANSLQANSATTISLA